MTKPPQTCPSLAELLNIMAALRHPETGCPWDKEQTFATIAPYTIEEAYEVADAIDRGDLIDLKDELGDLLLQVVYHARIAEEQGAFAFDDVAAAIAGKMIRRHPHVFGSERERAAGAAPDFWATIKAEERAAKNAERALAVSRPTTTLAGPDGSVLADVPLALPALMRAIKLQDKAARVGFDWPSLQPVFDKMREEMAELEAELSRPNRAVDGRQDAAVQDELGDLLFVMANVARHLKIDPEEALRGANQKFTRRFHHIERRLAEQGGSPQSASLDEMEALWLEAKFHERSKP
jgi:nucleoside triphosphate diphosphatase